MVACERQQGRNPLFCKRWFPDDVIILCALVSQVSSQLSRSVVNRCRDGGGRGALHDPTLGHPACRKFARRWEAFELVVGGSWRADETYIKVNGGWVYLYRAVDERGRTVASYLSRSRDLPAARIFFRKALKRHGATT